MAYGKFWVLSHSRTICNLQDTCCNIRNDDKSLLRIERYIPICDAHFMEQCNVPTLIMEFKITGKQFFQRIENIEVTVVSPLSRNTLLRNSMIIKLSPSLRIC